MRLVTTTEMFEIEHSIFNEYAIPSIVLMEQAGKNVADFLIEKDFTNIGIICGKGNNGGDGFVVARYLFEKEVDVTVIYIGNEYKNDALINFNICKNLGIPLVKFDFKVELSKYDVIVDAIFGIGFKGGITPFYSGLFDLINENAKYILSIDVPSGVNATTGKVTNSIKADTTITFGFGKIGLYLYPAYMYTGDLIIAPISIPKVFHNEGDYNTLLISEAYSLLPTRSPNSNKGTFGKVHVFCGSDNMVGASVLVTKAILKTGCGYVVSYGNERLRNAINNRVIEAVTKDISINIVKDIPKDEIKVIGSGFGLDNEAKVFFLEFIKHNKENIVIDGDGLTILSENLDLLKDMGNIILTPHPKEMSRLINIPIKEIVENTIDVARDFSTKYGVTLLLKGHRTVISNKDGKIYINTTGNSSLAKAGTGDVLTGIIGGLMSMGLDSFYAGILASYLHGKTGQLISEKSSEYSVLASDLIEYLGETINYLK